MVIPLAAKGVIIVGGIAIAAGVALYEHEPFRDWCSERVKNGQAAWEDFAQGFIPEARRRRREAPYFAAPWARRRRDRRRSAGPEPRIHQESPKFREELELEEQVAKAESILREPRGHRDGLRRRGRPELLGGLEDEIGNAEHEADPPATIGQSTERLIDARTASPTGTGSMTPSSVLTPTTPTSPFPPSHDTGPIPSNEGGSDADTVNPFFDSNNQQSQAISLPHSEHRPQEENYNTLNVTDSDIHSDQSATPETLQMPPSDRSRRSSFASSQFSRDTVEILTDDGTDAMSNVSEDQDLVDDMELLSAEDQQGGTDLQDDAVSVASSWSAVSGDVSMRNSS